MNAAIQPLKILLIEDSADYRDLICRLFELPGRFNVRVETSRTLAGGLKQAESNPPDLVLLDVHLPDAGGDEGFKEFVSRSIPVAVLTAYDNKNLEADLLSRGCVGWLLKTNLNRERLDELVAGIVDHTNAENDSSAIKTISVLLVEDTREFQEIISTYLQMSNRTPYQITIAASINNARNMLDNGRFDVVLLDLNLPDSQGAATFETIHGIIPTIPIVILTSMADEKLALSLMKKGAQDYLYKDKNHFDLLDRCLLYAIERQKSVQLLSEANESNHLLNRELTQALSVINEELEMARNLQQALLPAELNPMTEFVDVAAAYLPSGKVSGDLFDVFKHDGKLIAYIFDVVGHGIPAALMTTVSKQSIDQGVRHDWPFSGRVAWINQRLSTFLKPEQFVTGFFLEYDPQTRNLCTCRAGHTPAMLQQNADSVEELVQGGPPLAMIPGIEFSAEERILSPGSRLLLYTDGLVENRDKKGALYGCEAMEESFLAGAGKSAAEGLDLIVSRYNETIDPDQPRDDTTVLYMIFR